MVTRFGSESTRETGWRRDANHAWRNTSTVAHTVTADPAQAMTASNVQLPAGAEPFESQTLQPGQTFVHQFTVPGEYGYVCHIHEGSGMAGTITVK